MRAVSARATCLPTRQVGKITGGIGIAVILAFGAATGQSPHPTFFDTLNKGNEVCITDADLVALRSPSRMGASSDVERVSGVVPSRFKIQVLAVKTEDKVQKEKTELEGKIDLPVSIVFETPFYKLFAGDFGSKDSAEKCAAKLREMGYGDAWVARKAIIQH